jgi:hypothetical protein
MAASPVPRLTVMSAFPQAGVPPAAAARVSAPVVAALLAEVAADVEAAGTETVPAEAGADVAATPPETVDAVVAVDEPTQPAVAASTDADIAAAASAARVLR